MYTPQQRKEYALWILRSTHNPSQLPEVERLKDKAADLLAEMMAQSEAREQAHLDFPRHGEHAETADSRKDYALQGDELNCYGYAVKHVREAVMWAVSAATVNLSRDSVPDFPPEEDREDTGE